MNDIRKQSRFEFEADVVVAVDTQKQSGRLHNISRGGTFLTTESPPALGSRIKLLFDMPGLKEQSEIPCIVRWTRQDKGVGVQFETLKPIEVWGLNKLIRTLESD